MADMRTSLDAASAPVTTGAHGPTHRCDHLTLAGAAWVVCGHGCTNLPRHETDFGHAFEEGSGLPIWPTSDTAPGDYILLYGEGMRAVAVVSGDSESCVWFAEPIGSTFRFDEDADEETK